MAISGVVVLNQNDSINNYFKDSYVSVIQNFDNNISTETNNISYASDDFELYSYLNDKHSVDFNIYKSDEQTHLYPNSIDVILMQIESFNDKMSDDIIFEISGVNIDKLPNLYLTSQDVIFHPVIDDNKVLFHNVNVDFINNEQNILLLKSDVSEELKSGEIIKLQIVNKNDQPISNSEYISIVNHR